MNHSVWYKLFACILLVSFSDRPDAADVAPNVLYIEQGWDDNLRQEFYHTPQGSRMIPVKWFMALETDNQNVMFADNDNLTKYGFIEGRKTTLNPYSLPIGFAIDTVDIPGRGLTLGFTCAACHTADITVNGKVFRVDGAPARVDFDSFYTDLTKAVFRTYFDEGVFIRFAHRVLTSPTEEQVKQLRANFGDYQSLLAGDAVIRSPSLESGYGRVDALTQIVNSLAVTSQKEPSNLRHVSAPTSYPHLWLTPELEFVQWNPIASSPIARNGGEVLGVFGTSKLSGPKAQWYESSLLLEELHELELWIQDLQPPKWDEAEFGRINQQLAATGEPLFKRHCAGCHNLAPYKRTDSSDNQFGKTFIKIGRVDYRKVGTDPHYVESLLYRLVRTNEATYEANDRQQVVPALSFFLNAVGPVVRRSMDEIGLSDQERVEMNGFRLRPPSEPGGKPQSYIPPSFTDLKAGPLAGAWATGPYLHNGSVPTIYELLSPVEERRKVFWTGGKELDLQKLGLVSDNAPGRFKFDTSVPGNRNTGHLYPANGLSEDERLAIIEFIKTL